MSWIHRFRLRRRRVIDEALAPVRARVVAAGGPDFTSEEVLEAIRLWARIHGEPPTYTGWSRAHATARCNDGQVLMRMGEPGDWPTSRQVVRRFGSFSAAIAAAGFTPRPAHRPRKSTAVSGASTRISSASSLQYLTT